MSRGRKKLAQKLTCMDTSWEPYESELDEFQPPPGETSTVRTPPGSAVGTSTTDEDNTEEDDNASQYGVHLYERFEEDAFEWSFDEIGSSQQHGAPMPTQDDDQGTSGTQHEDRRRRKKSHRDRADVGYTPNMLPTQPKRARKPKAPFTPGS